MPELNEKAIESIAKLARESLPIRTPEHGVPFVVVPEGCKVESLAGLIFNEYAERPVRKTGTITVLDAPSFCEYFTHFSDSFSRVFADETKAKVLAVLDYHGAGDNAPRWGKHRLDWTLRKSPEWIRWTAVSGEKMSQVEFAEFLEDNAVDVVDPNAATMLEVARTLTAKAEVDFASAIRTANGGITLRYSEQVKGTYGSGDIEVPEQFSIAVPVFVGGDRARLVARLRYRIAGGKLTFWFDLLRADAAERAAFQGVRQYIADELKVVIINGVPA